MSALMDPPLAPSTAAGSSAGRAAPSPAAPSLPHVPARGVAQVPGRFERSGDTVCAPALGRLLDRTRKMKWRREKLPGIGYGLAGLLPEHGSRTVSAGRRRRDPRPDIPTAGSFSRSTSRRIDFFQPGDEVRMQPGQTGGSRRKGDGQSSNDERCSMSRDDRIGSVLVACADRSVRAALRGALEKSGMSVHEAERGHVALDAFERFRPDLLVLDAGLAKSHGARFGAAIRQGSVGVTIPVVMLTESGEPDDLPPPQELEIADVSPAPGTGTALALRIKHLIQGHRATAALRR